MVANTRVDIALSKYKHYKRSIVATWLDSWKSSASLAFWNYKDEQWNLEIGILAESSNIYKTPTQRLLTWVNVLFINVLN